MAGIYIHIPFCKKACNYCNFHFSLSNNYNELINSIIKEIELNQKKFRKNIVSSIYFGGGTPSIINEYLIQKIINKIFKNYNVKKNCEVTIEANPDDINEIKLESWKRSNINRVSLGVQSFNDNILLKINRTHDSKMAKEAIKKF